MALSASLISIHVLREEDDCKLIFHCAFLRISIPVLREEDDRASDAAKLDTAEFLSTSSARRTTAIQTEIKRTHPDISIHVLREEDDVFRH